MIQTSVLMNYMVSLVTLALLITSVCVCVCVSCLLASRAEDNFAALAGGSEPPLSEQSRCTRSVCAHHDGHMHPPPLLLHLAQCHLWEVDINICERTLPVVCCCKSSEQP